MKNWSKRFLWVVLIAICCSVTAYALTTPSSITFQGTISSQKEGLIQGRRQVEFSIYNSDARLWSETLSNVQFTGGVFSVILGANPNNAIPLSAYDADHPSLRVRVRSGPTGGTWSSLAVFPLFSTPYAVQSRISDSVLRVNSSQLEGAFTSTVNFQSDVFITNSSGQRMVGLRPNLNGGAVAIGKGTPNVGYKLDVEGIVNAQGYRLNGADLETSLSWQKNVNNLYYNRGFVGIGTTTPHYHLDVVGTVNAKAYIINGQNLEDYFTRGLSWKPAGSAGDIYFDDRGTGSGFVGIGTTEPTQRLDVRGAIRIGNSDAVQGLPGTIQYSRDNDFMGYVVQGNQSGWKSLTGLQGNGVVGRLAYWTGNRSLASVDGLFWSSDLARMGIGTTTPRARLEILAPETGAALLVRTALDQPTLYVANSRVGIGTTAPSQALDVRGIVDASGYLINGQPLDRSFSTDSFWFRENDNRIYYDAGNVGIGTSRPASLLELSSQTANPAITFDIAGRNLYTIGVSTRNQDAFVIARGGDLSVPVFTFQGQQIGIGTLHPSANLHVSGNSGVVFAGQFGSNVPLLERGPGAKLIWYPSKAAFRVGRVLNNDWDQEKIGTYSIGLGSAISVSGFGAAVLGGYKNVASGNYATVAGGVLNKAAGNYSFAAGFAAEAMHQGSFVWSDYTVPTRSFTTDSANQFIIRAANGVGVGTSNTLGAALTVAKSGDGYLFRAFGNGGLPAMLVSTSGNVGIGTSQPGTSKLAVMGGSVGIGTRSSSGALTIVLPRGATSNALVVYPSTFVDPISTPTASFVVTASGNVGIGVTAGYRFNGDLFVVRGAISATKLTVRDPNNPNAQINVQPNPGSPWSVDSRDNAYRTQGYVGIGTASPNTLLTLSNRNRARVSPILSYDIGGQLKYVATVTQNARRTGYVYGVQAGPQLTSTASFVVATSSVGIATGLNSHRGVLDVSGNVFVSGNVMIATTNYNPVYRIQVGGALNASRIFINGNQLVPPADDPWRTLNGNIYYPSDPLAAGNVGIGVSNPAYRLEVGGSISANSLLISRPLSLSQDLYTNQLLIKEEGSATRYGRFLVRNGQFTYIDPDGIVKSLSSSLRRGVGKSGTLTFWIDDSTLGTTDANWDDSRSQLNVSGNLAVKRVYRDRDFRVSANALLGGDSPISVSARLGHDGLLSTVRSFTAQKIAVDIDSNWGIQGNSPIFVKGVDINLQTRNQSILLNNATAVGLNVDVSSVNVDTVAGGQKYAAIFRGGNVGIGVTNPRAELEVAGTVSANYFNLTGGLTVPQLAVGRSVFVARPKLILGNPVPRVGIGITDPENYDSELVVRGSVSSNTLLVTHGITAATANIGSGAFVINASGNIGLGTTQPNGQIDVFKQINSVLSTDFTSQKIAVLINGARPSSVFYFNKNLTGMDINLSSAQSNQLAATATGINVDLSNLRLNGSKAVGLDVNVTGTTGTRYAAIFQGGRVGIGTTTPLVDLDVVGTLNATNLILRGNLQSSRATFNVLTVNRSATFNGAVTMNSLLVRGTITANILVLSGALEAPSATFSTLNAGVSSFNRLVKARDLTISNTFVGRTAVFSTAVGVGVTQPPVSGLFVSGNLTTDTLNVLDTMNLQNATLNATTALGNSYFLLSPQGRVGMGTSQPEAQVHVVSSTPHIYSAGDNGTWSLLRVQAKSNVSNTAAGVLFVPDNVVSSRTVGSGIAAIRSSDSAALPGSHLVLITDPSTGFPQERVRITDTGRVGIGLTSPQALLDVNGDVWVSGNLTINGGFTINRLYGDSGLTVIPNGLMNIQSVASFNKALFVDKGMYLKAGQDLASKPFYGGLYVGADNVLYYVKPTVGNTPSVPQSISGLYVGASNRIPYFSLSGNLASDAPVFWDNAQKRFSVGTSNVVSKIDLGVTLNALTQGSFAAQSISLALADRRSLIAPQTTTFTGLDLKLTGQTPSDPLSFGRLGQGESAVGLKVDVRQLSAIQYSPIGDPLQGYKMAAVFLGGGVGVGTTLPEAGLHVVSETISNTALRVDTASTQNVLTVGANGNVGIGVSSAASRLVVRGVNALSSGSALNVLNASNASLLYVRNDGRVGIGTTVPSANLHVIGTVSANIGSFGSVTATTLNVGNGNLFVNAAGSVGLGTTSPTGNLSFYKVFGPTNLPSQDFISHKIQLSVGDTQSNTQLFFNKNLTALDVSMQSLAGSVFGAISGPSAISAIGVSVNMSKLTLGGKGRAIGVFSDVSGATGQRYSAVFMGGNVGIGTSFPAYALDVSGDIRATNLRLSGSITAASATFNSLVVNRFATFNGTVSANRFVATSVTVNTLSVLGTFSVATASFTTVNASALGVFSRKVGIGSTRIPSRELEVSGNVWISKSVTVNGTLFASLLKAPAGITINAAQGVFVSGVVSANSFIRTNAYYGLKKQGAVPATSTAFGQIYVDTLGQINYLKPSSSSPIRLSVFGTPGRIPYFDSTGNLSSSGNVSWDDTAKTLRISTGNLEVLSFVDTNNTGDITAQNIQVSFGNRSASATNAKFTGMNILMQGLNPNDPFNFGRLGANEEAVGLRVDVSGLRSKYTQSQVLSGDGSLSGHKYAAAFLGGSVGVGTTTPEAAFHVLSTDTTKSPFRIDAGATKNALVVASTGFVGVGTPTPNARLSIKGAAGSTRSLLNVMTTSGASVLYVHGDGLVGVNTSVPSASFHIVPKVDLTPLLKVNTFSGSTAFVLKSDAKVGIGTDFPSANLHVVGESPFRVDLPGVKNYAMNVDTTGKVGIGLSSPFYPLSVGGVVMSGTPNTTLGLQFMPTWLLNSTQARGFLANTGRDNAFFGVRPATVGSGTETVFWWGSNSTDMFKFEHYNGTTTQNVFALRGDGRVLISTSNIVPSATLHVKGRIPLWISTPSLPNVLMVSSNGSVGIGTKFPSANLHVAGTLMANNMNVLSGSLRVSTLNVTHGLTVYRAMQDNVVATAQGVELRLHSDVDQDVTALNIKMDADTHALLAPRKYTVFNGASAIGLKVDVSNLIVGDPVLPQNNKPGYKVAAAFIGGDVGIGPDDNFRARFPLHVETTLQTIAGVTFADIARFGTNQGDLTLRDFGQGRMGFMARSISDPDPSILGGVSNLGLVFSRHPSDASVGFIGIGVTNPDKALVVNGDVRVGTVRNTAGAPESAGIGAGLYFSGGPDVSATYDTDNNVPMFMRRYNGADGQSELQVGVGKTNSDQNSKFVVGYDNSGTYKPILDVRVSGKVGISDGATAFDPQSTLHVKGSVAGASDRLASHLVTLENAGGTDADTLAIYHSNILASGNASFISFFSGSSPMTLVGAIKSNPLSGGGVQYLTSGADYAEYLPKVDPKESIERGDIVGVIYGKVSKNTQGAQQVMVKSSAASVAGNYPGEARLSQFSLTAFFGQVPVKVTGLVHRGDFILPSSLNDGTGVAINPDQLDPAKTHLIVGTAWEDSDQPGMKYVRTAVGFHFSLPNASKTAVAIEKLATQVESLKAERGQITKNFDEKLAEQNRQIEALMKELKR